MLSEGVRRPLASLGASDSPTLRGMEDSPRCSADRLQFAICTPAASPTAQAAGAPEENTFSSAMGWKELASWRIAWVKRLKLGVKSLVSFKKQIKDVECSPATAHAPGSCYSTPPAAQEHSCSSSRPSCSYSSSFCTHCGIPWTASNTFSRFSASGSLCTVQRDPFLPTPGFEPHLELHPNHHHTQQQQLNIVQGQALPSVLHGLHGPSAAEIRYGAAPTPQGSSVSGGASSSSERGPHRQSSSAYLDHRYPSGALGAQRYSGTGESSKVSLATRDLRPSGAHVAHRVSASGDSSRGSSGSSRARYSMGPKLRDSRSVQYLMTGSFCRTERLSAHRVNSDERSFSRRSPCPTPPSALAESRATPVQLCRASAGSCSQRHNSPAQSRQQHSLCPIRTNLSETSAAAAGAAFESDPSTTKFQRGHISRSPCPSPPAVKSDPSTPSVTSGECHVSRRLLSSVSMHQTQRSSSCGAASPNSAGSGRGSSSGRLAPPPSPTTQEQDSGRSRRGMCSSNALFRNSAAGLWPPT